MRLEEIGIQLRPRSASEALDLGRVMMQAWYGGPPRASSLTSPPPNPPLLGETRRQPHIQRSHAP